ncbi:MAG: hypothetical protein Q8P90_01320, partial [bacterium]|nr:hypothetical protein [bacterium]
MPTSPERQLKPKPIKPADENRAGVQMDGSRFSDTAFDTYDATDYSENPDLETINPADQAHKLLDELQIAIAEKLRTLNGHRQKLEDDHSFIEDARKEIHQWTSSIRRIVNKVMEALERNTNNQNEYENRIAEVSQTIEDLSGIQEQAERLKEQIIIAGADHVAEHLLPEIQFLYTDAFDAHELGFDQPSQQFFIEGDNLSSIEVGEIVREQLYENIKEKGYADVWDDSIETVVDQEDTNLLEVVDALWSIEVGENIDPPVEITIKNRQYILTKKLGQGGVGVVFAARRFPNEKEIADGQGPRDVVI